MAGGAASGTGVAVAASVSGSSVDPVGVHSASAQAATQQPGQQVGAGGAVLGRPSRADRLHGEEVPLGDQWRVRDLLRDDAGLCRRVGRGCWRVPVVAGAVPALTPGVPGIIQDHRDRAQGPRFAGSMGVTLGIDVRRARNASAVQRPVRVRSGVNEAIAIGWSAAEITALVGDLVLHGGEDTVPGSKYLSL